MSSLLRGLPIVIVLMALVFGEWRRPWRSAQPRHRRGNLALGALSFVTVLLLPLASMTVAAHWAVQRHVGLLHHVDLPAWLQIVSSLLVLDLALYAQHRVLHGRWLWPLHWVHHTDPMLDITSGVRFHPLEAGASALYKSLVIVLLGAPVTAVAISAALTLAASLFTHANLQLGTDAERWARRLLVTPALHRIHHSSVHAETQRNFGSVLWLWDCLFGTAATLASKGHGIELGVEGQAAQTRLWPMLTEPFKNRPAITRSQ